jgi:hypothetical protein
MYATVFAALGRWDEAEAERKLVEASDHGDAKIQVRILFGDIRGAVDAFLKFTEKSTYGTVYGCDPLFDPLKRDPRFAERLTRTGAKLCPATTPWPIPAPPPKYSVKR